MKQRNGWMWWAAAGLITIAASLSCNSQGMKPVRVTGPRTFNHDLWNSVLQKYVKDGRVDYEALKSDEDFSKYINQLAMAAPNALGSHEEKIAFWINAYNASVVHGVLSRYPIKSVMDDKEFFKKKEHTIGGTSYSLGEIENGILRKQFKEPRVHFALNCASASCPSLRPGAYTAAELNTQLAAAAKEFINDPTRNRFDVAKHAAALSSIFDWYQTDFGGRTGALKFIAKYTPPAIGKMLKSGKVKVTYLKYDWSLNAKR